MFRSFLQENITMGVLPWEAGVFLRGLERAYAGWGALTLAGACLRWLGRAYGGWGALTLCWGALTLCWGAPFQVFHGPLPPIVRLKSEKMDF